MKHNLSILLLILIAMFGCKKSPNATCNTTRGFAIASGGDITPGSGVPGDTINFAPEVVVAGSALGNVYGYDPNAFAGCTFLWNFGDGSTSTAQLPSHVYESIGTDTVRLTINGDSAVSVSYIYIYPVPIYAAIIAGTWQWKHIHVVTDSIHISDTTTLSDTTFKINMINEENISIASINLFYVPYLSTNGPFVYASGGIIGQVYYYLTFNHITNKMQYVVDYEYGYLPDTADIFERM